MDKSNHTVTVPREYLEELEKFKEENQTDYNAKATLRHIGQNGNVNLFLELRSTRYTGADVSNVANGIIIVDNEGRELGRFVNKNRF